MSPGFRRNSGLESIDAELVGKASRPPTRVGEKVEREVHCNPPNFLSTQVPNKLVDGPNYRRPVVRGSSGEKAFRVLLHWKDKAVIEFSRAGNVLAID